jgi:predicted RNA-binding protein with PUA-like domain
MSDEAAFQPWVGQHPDGTADDAPEPYTRVASCRETKVDRLVASTGGRVFYAKEYENLDEVYDEIETELRSQYLLTYYPKSNGGNASWRHVDVQVVRQGLRPRTLSGYWP